MGRTFLTVGFSTRDDYHGAWMTVEGLLAYHDEWVDEIVVVDNSPQGSKHAEGKDSLSAHLKGLPKVRYVRAVGPESSCLYKERMFQEASGEFVMCCDSHVLFERGSLEALVGYWRANPDSRNIVTGPCLAKVGRVLGTNQALYESEGYKLPDNAEVVNGSIWRNGAAGIWMKDERGLDPANPPFVIQQQGTGCFSMRRAAWVGFHPSFTGHGGNETYLFEKVRQRGGQAVCIPALRWVHRFGRPDGIPYHVNWQERVQNYLTGFRELRRFDLVEAAEQHFARVCPQNLSKAQKEPDLETSLRADWLSVGGDSGGSIPPALFREIKQRVRHGMRTLELGSGLSTLLFDKLGAHHTAIESSPQWAAKIEDRLGANTQLVLAPLVEDRYQWSPPSGELFDLVLVDGPSNTQGGDKRDGCLELLDGLLSPNAVILLDDTHRAGEQALSRRLEERFGLKARRLIDSRRSFDVLSQSQTSAAVSEGPGTELKKLFALLGIKDRPGCGCADMMRQMNEWGVEGCQIHRSEILAWLAKNAKKYGWRDRVRAALRVRSIGVEINVRAPMTSLFEEALRRSA